eukprot:CAMPEP_0171120614 /NCGR_PEP_ID=MMETSP0766_2-20121228/100133_1 /TAXON_ID=439317 /ORGANISM="Gambierdiscus australes, Strain CAWD 149" /LENGTH=110 /DNA_ID=CAMNT_0011583355 /DNA_START=271 /DNA_END=604 /DNA_ORIENTATION=+
MAGTGGTLCADGLTCLDPSRGAVLGPLAGTAYGVTWSGTARRSQMLLLPRSQGLELMAVSRAGGFRGGGVATSEAAAALALSGASDAVRNSQRDVGGEEESQLLGGALCV